MKKSGKTKEQLLNELTELRQRIAELEVMENTYKKAKEALLNSFIATEWFLCYYLFNLCQAGRTSCVSTKTQLSSLYTE
ncbi:MAG: hypothetical protein Q8N09_04180 [Thermodesulfovibrionia bacterium]|nr:hypothetical protein [Thermodesulfovibrionia bacterium]